MDFTDDCANVLSYVKETMNYCQQLNAEELKERGIHLVPSVIIGKVETEMEEMQSIFYLIYWVVSVVRHYYLRGRFGFDSWEDRFGHGVATERMFFRSCVAQALRRGEGLHHSLHISIGIDKGPGSSPGWGGVINIGLGRG